MAAMGTCECGARFHQINKRRTTCSVCQVLRDLTFRPYATHNCDWCGEKFWPVRLTYKICPKCLPSTANSDKWPACTRCGSHNRPAPGLDTTCISCVQSGADLRKAYVKTLGALRAARRDAREEDRQPPETWGEEVARRSSLPTGEPHDA